jgi:carbonic anhydrase/acetyltransferase-like protein (isoleucine patch superfamily)
MLRRIHDVFIADTARVLGEVTLGRNVSVWYSASIRGDVAPVVIGEGTNVQDGAVIHCDHTFANVIGSHVTIGHGAVVHGEKVGDGSLIGMGAKVLGHTFIGKRCLIAAGAVVPPGLVVPDDMVVMGVPGKIVRETNDKEKQYLAWLAPHYVRLATAHVEQPTDPRFRPWNGNR